MKVQVISVYGRSIEAFTVVINEEGRTHTFYDQNPHQLIAAYRAIGVESEYKRMTMSAYKKMFGLK